MQHAITTLLMAEKLAAIVDAWYLNNDSNPSPRQGLACLIRYERAQNALLNGINYALERYELAYNQVIPLPCAGMTLTMEKLAHDEQRRYSDF